MQKDNPFVKPIHRWIFDPIVYFALRCGWESVKLSDASGAVFFFKCAFFFSDRGTVELKLEVRS